MASTITLQRTAQFCQQHVKGLPLTSSANTFLDPLASMADWVRQFIVSPPFAWRWNRAQVSATLTQGQQDFTLSVPDFGWIEKSIYVDSTGATYELQAVEALGQEASQSQPTSIAVLLDDDVANVTFRIFPPPPNDCTVNVIYQKAAGTFQSLADTWAPIPDWLSFLFTQGTLAKTYEYADDPRALPAMQIFIKQVVAACEGLKDADKAIFVPELAQMQRTQSGILRKAQMGDAARGLFS